MAAAGGSGVGSAGVLRSRRRGLGVSLAVGGLHGEGVGGSHLPSCAPACLPEGLTAVVALRGCLARDVCCVSVGNGACAWSLVLSGGMQPGRGSRR